LFRLVYSSTTQYFIIWHVIVELRKLQQAIRLCSCMATLAFSRQRHG